MRVSLIVLTLFSLSVFAQPEEEATCSGSIWDDFFTNLDNMFWRPWLDKYRVIRYTTRAPRGQISWTEEAWLSRSCSELGLSRFSSVALIHEAAWLNRLPHWISERLVGTTGSVPAALQAIRMCSTTAWASNTELRDTMNMTMQSSARCAYATKSLRCAFGNLYWVLSYGVIGIAIFGASASFLLFGSILCCCWCWTKEDD